MTNGRLWLWAAYALLVLSCVKDIANPDIFWHLSAGGRILAERAIPFVDWLSFTRAGTPWVDFEWLPQALFAAAHLAAGWWGLIALKTALIAAAARLIERELGRRGLDHVARACAVAVLTACWAISNDLRPEWFTMAFVCLELVWLERLRDGDRVAVSKLALASTAGGCLWANCHAGFILGLILAACYASLLQERAARKKAAAFLAGGLAGTFLTPFGPRLYVVIMAHLKDAAVLGKYIIEWFPASPFNQMALPMWALLGGCALTAAIAPPKRRELPAWTALSGLAFLALRHQRNIPLFCAAGVLLAPLLLARRKGFDLHPLCAPVNVLLAAVFLALNPQPLTQAGLANYEQPEGAAVFLRGHPDVARLRLYNPWGWGGYLAWAVGGSYRVFYDGRYIFHDLLAPSIEAAKAEPAWNRFLDEQRIDGAVLDQRPRAARVSQAVSLMPPKRWKLVYADSLALIYLRK